ncbi:MAG: lipid-A-disaccharide synthase [Flavobacteriales bacterium AspAUS03]
MKYYIIAGEASGDLHGSNLMKALKCEDVSAHFRYWGGALMEAEGGVLVKDYRDLDFMGFWEVLKRLPTILRNIRLCKEDIRAYRPDAVILIDYPGFNLRVADFVNKLGINVFYCISPKVWAWKRSRIYRIEKTVNKMFVILPFEKDFYKRYGVDVEFVGHPILDAIHTRVTMSQKDFIRKHRLDGRPIIALLPGSRRVEISYMFPLMWSIRKAFPAYQFVVAGVSSQPRSYYEALVGEEVCWVKDQTYDLLACSHAALVTSGTATLETALFEVPQVVCYKGSWISYEIARYLVRHIRFISLVNLIMDREVVEELIQKAFTLKNLERALLKILDSEHRALLLSDYRGLRERLGGPGASQRTAQRMMTALKSF